MDLHVAAVDLGASSGRVLLGRLDAARPVDERTLQVQEFHRFDNGFVRRGGQDCWDVERLVHEITTGLEKILAAGIVPASVGIDTWGVDFVLLDAAGQRLGEAVSYRDHRTDGVMEQVFATVSRAELYERTGIQFLQFNTLFQLAALRREQPAWWPQVATLLFMPDYLHYRLCGVLSCEYTNASTSGLLHLADNQWDGELLRRLGLPAHWFGPLSQPGTRLGEWVSAAGVRVPVIAPATHDTGSAVMAVPFEGGARFESAYISSGTWSLMGIESDRPCHDARALAANLTNEGGSDGTYRVLKNIMGLWLIQRVRDTWPGLDFAALVREAEAAEPFASLIQPDDARFLNPPSMVEAIRGYCAETGQPVPRSAGAVARCVFESLAFLYRLTLEDLRALSGRALRRIHIVGGGCRNEFLNQLCADFCVLPVHTGPVEASALGNLACQLRALGQVDGLAGIRALVRRSDSGHVLMPRAEAGAAAAAHWPRFLALSGRALPAEAAPATPPVSAFEGALS